MWKQLLTPNPKEDSKVKFYKSFIASVGIVGSLAFIILVVSAFGRGDLESTALYVFFAIWSLTFGIENLHSLKRVSS